MGLTNEQNERDDDDETTEFSMSKRPDPPGASPPAKRHKDASPTKKQQQSSLLNFFSQQKQNDPWGLKQRVNDDDSNNGKHQVSLTQSASSVGGGATGQITLTKHPSSAVTSSSATLDASNVIAARKKEAFDESKGTVVQQQGAVGESNHTPIIPCHVKPSVSSTAARWKVVHGCILVRTLPKEELRTKVAAFDLDNTLLVWRISGWPSQYEHYELWNASVVTKFQALHDDGYKLVIFSNQGAIRSAVTGKKATFVKSLIEWLASAVQRPIHVCMSTDRKKGYHKPNPGMWQVCEQECNAGIKFALENSFYVGDSVGDDDQGGVDEAFAKNIGNLTFYEPQHYLGPSAAVQRKKQNAMQDHDKPSAEALKQQAALFGGYLKHQILLVLCGVQGSGKSTFCETLLKDSASDSSAWIVLSQDTINKGKPGKREVVEDEARKALQNGKSVVVDRMHLNEEQRAYFVAIAKEFNVNVHALLLQPPKDLIATRVRQRTNHPGKVEGEKGVRIALASLGKVVVPKYSEGFDLVSCAGSEQSASRLTQLYRCCGAEAQENLTLPHLTSTNLLNGVSMPSLALGTMGLGKRKCAEVIKKALQAGFKAIDTAPTYKNEQEVGQGLSQNTFTIVKVPKRVTLPNQVREELKSSLSNLDRKQADLLLLHWPCDVFEAGTLQSVWNEMEKCLDDGLCCSLGVCNFSVDALRQLIPLCKVPPSVNQVERHPLLPQMELFNFCLTNDIILQAHTPLGQGRPELLENETVAEVSKTTGLSCAQVSLKWNLQQGVAAVPKCTSDDHLKQAIGVLETPNLTGTQMEKLSCIAGVLQKRFVAPPFMYGRNSCSWGERRPTTK